MNRPREIAEELIRIASTSVLGDAREEAVYDPDEP